MLAIVPHPVLDRLSLVLVIGLLAAPLTFLQVVQPSLGDIQNTLGISKETPQKPAAVTPAQQTPTKPVPTAVPKPVPAPAASPVKTTAKTALTSSFVNLRAGKSVSTPIIGTLEAGTTVQLRADADTTWQGVTYQGKNGYIYRSYLQY